MDANRENLNKWDYGVSISSGAITAALDVFWVQDFSLADAHGWGASQVETFVIRTARSRGYQGNKLSGAVKALEDLYPIPADDLTHAFGGGAHHHLRDFSHHPTIVGLLFSVLSQFTGKGYGTDKSGRFLAVPFPDWTPPDLCTGLYNGTVQWLFHMISDIAGSSSTIRDGGEGTGLPGPVMSFLKEVSAIPGVRELCRKDGDEGDFPAFCTELFSGALLGEHDEKGRLIKGKELRFDFRTELGIAHEAVAGKQMVPVAINEMVVCSFYSVSRFCSAAKDVELRRPEDLRKLNFRDFLPWNSPALRRMRTLAAVTFSAIDISAAGIRAALKFPNDPSGFALELLQNINYAGMGHLSIALSGELCAALGKLHRQFLTLAREHTKAWKEANPDTAQVAAVVKKAAVTTGAVLQAGTPMGFVSAVIGVYGEISRAAKALNLAYHQRLETEQICRRQIHLLTENREEMERAVSGYLYEHLTAFDRALETMDAAIRENDADGFIQGNVMLQKQLGKTAAFGSVEEFDELMALDAPLKL